MGINSPKGPDDVDFQKLIRLLLKNPGTDAVFRNPIIDETNAQEVKKILHLKSDATTEEIGQAIRNAFYMKLGI
jgi:hypothetical protein